MKKYLFLFTIVFFAASCGVKEIPLVYDVENSGAKYAAPVMPGLEQLPVTETLPDPLEWSDGSGRVKNFSQWEKRRNEIFAEIQHYEVGTKPAVSKDCVTAEFKKFKEKTAEEIAAIEAAAAERPFGRMGIAQALMKNVDTLVVTTTVNGESIVMNCPIIMPEGDGPFPAIIGVSGFGAGSLPQDIFSERNIAMIGFPFSSVTAHTQKRGEEPINKLYPELVENGSYTWWPWGISRLIDGLEILGPEVTKIDTKHLAVSGCSYAGKMALFSGAFDERIALTIAQEPGGGGAAAWRVSETLGNVETLGRTNYSWFKESMRQFELENVASLPMDHHELCALVAPRALLVLGNPDFEWLADEAGYVSCNAARKVWEAFGIQDRMGYSFEDEHGHCQLPESQYPHVEAFVDRFLLGKDVDTQVTYAPMFEDVDVQKWINW